MKRGGVSAVGGAGAAVRVAVYEAASSYRRGLGAELQAKGYGVEEVDRIRVESLVNGVDAVLFSVRSASDWDVLRQGQVLNPDVKFIALLVDATPDRHAEALRCGAHGVAAWEAAPEVILAVLAAALEGTTLLPTPTAQAMAACGPALYDPDWITDEEVGWLRVLAGGATVLQLADKVGYSERALYRMLHGLYGRMRVANRTEAILQASRWGLLEQ